MTDITDAGPRLKAMNDRLHSADSGYTHGISAGAEPKPTLTPAEREAIEGMAAYFDTRGNITLQAWGSLLRVLLMRLGDE